MSDHATDGWMHIRAYDARLSAEGRPAGVVYTPPELARAVVGWVMEQVPCGERLPTILEPGCGAGSLLVPIVEQLWKRRPSAVEILEALRAEEIDPQAAHVARRAVWATLRALGADVAWPLKPDPVRIVDCLKDDATPEPVDVVIGNPPYVFGAALDVKERARLVRRFELAQGTQVDLFRLFVEATLSRVRPGGLHGFIVPDAVLARDELSDVRRWLLQRGTLVGVGRCGAAFRTPTHDGGSRAVAMGVALIVMQRSREDLAPRSPVVRRWNRKTGHFEAPRAMAEAAVPTNGDPWQVAAPTWWFGEGGLRAKLERSDVVLGSVLQPGAQGATRGEELGRRSLDPDAGPDRCTVLTGRQVMRMRVEAATHTLERARLRKSAQIYAPPRFLMVKTGATPVASADLDSSPVLQSIYVLHPAPESGWDVWALAAVISSVWLGAYAVCRWTAVKAVQPQLTLRNVRGLPLPQVSQTTIATMSALSRHLHSVSEFEERCRLEHALDRCVGEAFGLDLSAWETPFCELLQNVPSSQRSAWITKV